ISYLFFLCCLHLLCQSSPYETAALVNTPVSTNTFSKQKHLKYPLKRTLLGRTISSHPALVNMSNTSASGVSEGTCATDESHQVGEKLAVSGTSENGGKQEDLEECLEVKISCSAKMEENSEQENGASEEDNIEQGCEAKEETEEIHQQSSNGNGEDTKKEGRLGSHPDKDNCISSHSEEANSQSKDTDTEIEKNNVEVLVGDDTPENYQTKQARKELTSELCKAPQVCLTSLFPAIACHHSFVVSTD
ncbi:uncharacterized protein LOC140707618, partial [Pogona vitticeps]